MALQTEEKIGHAVPMELLEALRALRSPIMIAHVVPDADAVGSMLGLARALTTESCKPKVSLPPRALSKKLEFLAQWADVPLATTDDFAQADGFLALDTAKQRRCNVGPQLKDTDWLANRCLINIDHHGSSTRFGTLNWVVESAGSTCELVYYLLKAAQCKIDPVVASLLYGGILTDTGGFSLPTASAVGLRAASDLVALGANVTELGERLCRSQRQSDFDLLRIIYANTKVLDGGVAYSSASYHEIREAGCVPADIDDQVSIPRSLVGVRLAMLFTEGNKGQTRLNFRGSGNVTVVELAAQFNGGGHAQAAGAILNCGLEEAIDRVVPKALEHVQSFPET